MPQVAEIEKAGIPTVSIVFPDQELCFRQQALRNGVPNIRSVHVSRTDPPAEDVARIIKPLMEALTRSLTGKELEKGRWEAPDKRVLFEGTLEEADEFYSQTE